MSTSFSALVLLLQNTKDDFFNAALTVARLVGLPTTTWRVGDPTRTLFRAQSEALETLENVQVEFAKASFLETAEGDWKTLRALDVYGVEREEATFATASVTFDNAGGGLFEIDVGGLVVQNSSTGKTYQNQAVVSINPLETGVVVSVVAQESGSGSSAAADEIDTIVTPTMADVSIVSSTAAVGSDEQSDDGLEEQCLDTLGALSPNGAPDAYEYIVKASELTGVSGIVRAFSDGDSADGTVTVYAATATAGIDGATVMLLQAAVDQYTQPLCTDATVASGTPQSVNINATTTPSSIENAVSLMTDALNAFFATVPINGSVSESEIHTVFHNTLASRGLTKVVLNSWSDVTLTTGRFPVLGSLAGF